MALMDGLRIQWLRDPSRIDLVVAASALFPAKKRP
ncbi:hypothetical protein BJY16_003486 [Actinoplanes octamycinicus]|uniref:Uncharacterized protein n=1 Tax=Actinoplanes octamycinicus TaxID=135948 RepID=A0A7W7M7L8_9ACTN|nr:hypothetical protein [Actinoplanes octamycinicus]